MSHDRAITTHDLRHTRLRNPKAPSQACLGLAATGEQGAQRTDAGAIPAVRRIYRSP
jgi:hypothetical protein